MQNGWIVRTGLVIKFKQINPKNVAIHCRCRDLQCKHEAGDRELKLTADRNFSAKAEQQRGGFFSSSASYDSVMGSFCHLELNKIWGENTESALDNNEYN